MIMNGNRIARAFGWGVVATIAMSALMIIGTLTGVSPMPKPIPAAIVGTILGKDTPQPLIMVLGAIAHLCYGGFWAAALAAVVRPLTIWKGILLGMCLWLVMQVLFLPLLGWGLFGTAHTPKIAVATLILHVVYGAALGWLVDREYVWFSHPHQPQLA